MLQSIIFTCLLILIGWLIKMIWPGLKQIDEQQKQRGWNYKQKGILDKK